MTYLLLGCTPCLWPEQTGEKFGFDPIFFSYSEHVAGSIRAFDAGFDIRGWSFVFLLCAASSFISALELQSCHRYLSLPYRLQSATWSRFYLLVVFLRVFGIIAHLALVSCLHKSHHQDKARDATMSISAFSLKKNVFIQNYNLNLYHICQMYPHFVFGWM